MPGLVGFVGLRDGISSLDLLSDMICRLESDNKYISSHYHEFDIGLGIIGLKFTNPEKQLIWDQSTNICVVFDGELYDTDQLRRDLVAKGYPFTVGSDAELILHLYQEYHEDTFPKLNGAFAIAIWDRSSRKLVLTNDRLGLCPLYYAYYENSLRFASGVRALFADERLPRQVDRIAIAEFLTFDHVLYDRTFLEAVRLLPQGSILTYRDDRLEINKYWTLKPCQNYPLRSETDYIEEFLFLSKQAVARQVAHDEHRSGILLSGGLDSRLLLAYLTEVTPRETIRSFTWGIPGCDDARYAKEISQLLGVEHHFFELKPDWLLEKAEEAVRITDGLGNLVNLHALATLESEMQYANVIYKGFLGDAMMGYGLMHQHWAEYNGDQKWKAHFQVHTDQGVITFNTDEQKHLFTELFQKEIGNSVWEHYISGMLDSGLPFLAQQRLYFDYHQRVPRMTIKGVEVVHSGAIVRLPFADNDLVEFSLRLPPGLLYERRLMKNAFIRAFPKLAQIPTTETGYPMMICARDVWLRAGHVLEWHIKSSGLKKLLPKRNRHYGKYNQWFRTVLRDWVETILLNKRTLDRGYYNPDYVRNLVSNHMAGANYSVQLGALLSIELWHRMFID